jgi:hypothetical protein
MMPRGHAPLVALLVAAPTPAAAQRGPLGPVAGMRLTEAREIALARSASAPAVSDSAGVFVFGSQGYVRVKASRNGFECMVNRDSFLDGYDALKPTCWDAEGARTILPMLLYIGELAARGMPRDSIRRAVGAGYAAGRFQPPARTGIAYMFQGDIAAFDAAAGTVTARAFPPHVMIYAPGITEQALGTTEAQADKDLRLPMIYTRGPGYGFIIIRVP